MPIWLLKLFAASLVVFSTSVAGFSVAKGFRDRPRQLRALQSVLQGLATEIAYGATPLPEAFLRLGRASRQPIASLFLAAAAALAEPGATAELAWRQGVLQLAGNSALQETDLAILGQLGSLLGLSDRSDQERHLSLAVQQLAREEARAEEARQSNERMWRYLGVLSGLLLVIVLI